MANPIGISFIPSQDNQNQGPQRSSLEGPGGDLAQAFKVLSLRLPQVLGARSIASRRLLESPGASGVSAGGANPMSAVFEALLRAMSGQSSAGGGYGAGLSSSGLSVPAPGQSYGESLGGIFGSSLPRVIPGDRPSGGTVTPAPPSVPRAGTPPPGGDDRAGTPPPPSPSFPGPDDSQSSNVYTDPGQSWMGGGGYGAPSLGERRRMNREY